MAKNQKIDKKWQKTGNLPTNLGVKSGGSRPNPGYPPGKLKKWQKSLWDFLWQKSKNFQKFIGFLGGLEDFGRFLMILGSKEFMSTFYVFPSTPKPPKIAIDSYRIYRPLHIAVIKDLYKLYEGIALTLTVIWFGCCAQCNELRASQDKANRAQLPRKIGPFAITPYSCHKGSI